MKINYEKLIFYFAILFILCGIIAKVLLIYTLPLGFNEGGYGLVASGILDGKDVFDHKPPFLHYLLAFWMSAFGKTAVAVHYLAFVLDMLLAVSIFFISRKYLGNKKATIASAIYMALSLVSGISIDTEIPSALFGFIGIFFYLEALKGNKINYFLSGIFIAISIWFKQPAVLFFAGILIHQAILCYKKEINIKEALKNVSLNLLGILVLSLPLLSYFLWREGSLFIYKIITFNLLFKGSTSRILAMGNAVYLIVTALGLLFIPLFNNKTKHHKEYSVFMIFIVLWTIFFLANQEVFYTHFFHIIPFLIIAFMFASEGYSGGENKLIIALIILILLTPTLINLNNTAREVIGGAYEKQNEVINYLNSEIPENARVFSDNPSYQFALGKDSLYKIPGLAPSFSSVFNLSDFCEFSKGLDYLILTHREKYLGSANLNCTLNNFSLVRRFDKIGESFVEVWRIK